MSSNSVDERVVDMQFNNRQFESGVKETLGSLEQLKKGLDFTGAGKSLSDLDSAGKKVSFASLAESVESIASKFTALGVIGITALANIANAAVNAGKKIAMALTIDPIMQGFKEYETQIGAIQTILANTASKGTTLNDVNAALDELNTYSDKTIYNFTEMARNIGTFTAAGVELDVAVSAIKGIANLAAVSGSTSQQAAVAMYQLSQAISSGTVKLMDWNSVVNAGMGGQVFQDALKETARVHGIAIDDMIEKQGSFRNTLQEGWLTSEILTETLSKFTGDLDEAQLKAMGYTEQQIQEIMKLGQMASDAATKVKTFSQLFDTLKEAATSGWAQSWRIIIGDFGEAKETLTEFSDILGGMINKASDLRNALLTEGLSSGWKQLLSQGIADEAGFIEVITSVAQAHSISVDDLIAKYGSFEASLESGWLTADILSYSLNVLANKTKDLSDEELKAMGYTREQIKALEDLNTAVQDGSISMEEYADKMLMLSGRQNLIQSLKNAFDAVLAVIKPIKEAFTNIFPPMTGEQLYNITVKIKEFTESLKIGDTTAEDLKRTFQGVFAVFDIVGQLISAVAKGIGRLFKALAPAAAGILDFTGDIGDWLVSLDEMIKKSDIFNKVVTGIGDFIALAAEKVKTAIGVIIEWFEALKENPTIQAIGEFLEPIIEKIKSGVESIIEWFKSFGEIDTSGIDNFVDRVKTRFEPLTKLFEGVKKVFEWIGGVLKEVAPVFFALAKMVGDAFKKLQERISKAVGEADFNSIFDLLNTGLLSGILIGVNGFVKSLSDISEKAGGFLESVKGILDGVKDSLQAYQDSLKAGVILKIAIAIGILAISLVALSLIDSVKLTTALAAISILFTDLVGSMAVFNKTMGAKEMKNVGKIAVFMIAISVALLLLVAAVKSLADLNWEDLAKGMAGVTALMGMLIGAAKLLSMGKNDDIIKGAFGFILFAAALVILTSAVKSLAELSWEGLAKGLVGVAALMGMLVGAAMLVSMGDSNSVIKGALGYVLLATAIVILAEVVEKFAGMSWEELAKGLISITVLLTMLALFTTAVEGAKGMVKVAVGMVLIGAAMLILATAIERMGNLSWEQIAKGLVTMAGALGLIAGAMWLMPNPASMLANSIGLIGIAAALLILSGVLTTFGGMTWEEIAKGLVVLAGSLLIIALAMMAMTAALPGAAALLVVAVAMTVLGGVLQSFGQMSWEEIGKSLLMLAASFVILGVAGLVLAPLVPVLLGLGAAVLLIGIGFAMAGAGILLFSAGLAALAVSGAAGAAALVLIVTSIIGLIPFLITQIGVGIVALAGVITAGAPAIGEAILAVVLTLIEVFVAVTPPLLEAIGLFLIGFLGLLVELTPQLVEAGMSIILSILEGIASNIQAVVEAGIDIMVNFINGIASKLPDIIDAAFNLIISFINGLADGIRNNTEPMLDACENLVTAIVEGVLSFIDKVIDVGEDLINGFIEGVKNMAEAIWDAVVGVVADAVDGVKNFLGIASPSKLLEDVGEFTGEGFANGLSKMAGNVDAASEELGDAAVDGVKAAAEYISDAISSDMQPTITPVIDMTNFDREKRKFDKLFGSAVGFKVNGAIDTAKSIATDPPQPTKPSVNIQITVNPKDLSQGQVDYLVKKVNLELGGMLR